MMNEGNSSFFITSITLKCNLFNHQIITSITLTCNLFNHQFVTLLSFPWKDVMFSINKLMEVMENITFFPLERCNVKELMMLLISLTITLKCNLFNHQIITSITLTCNLFNHQFVTLLSFPWKDVMFSINKLMEVMENITFFPLERCNVKELMKLLILLTIRSSLPLH